MLVTAAQLITDFCNIVGIAEPDKVITGTPFEIRDVLFTLGVDEKQSDSMLLYVEFGDPPTERQAEAAWRLLEHNYLLFEDQGSFTISPMTGKVIYVQRLPANDFTGETLLQQLGYLSEKAKEWREGFFLDDPSQTQPS